MSDDYPMSASVWDRFIQPQFPARTFPFTVSNGYLDVVFTGPCHVFGMIVYPDLGGLHHGAPHRRLRGRAGRPRSSRTTT